MRTASPSTSRCSPHHAVRGRALDKAVRYLHQAGAKAVARSAKREAIGFFERALAFADAQTPRDPRPRPSTSAWRWARAHGRARAAAPPRSRRRTARAPDLAERVGDAARRFPALWGLWFVNYTRGRYADALDAGRALLETAADGGGDSGMMLEAHHALWPTLLAMGEAARPLPTWSAASPSTTASGTPRRRRSTAGTTPACAAATSSRWPSGARRARPRPRRARRRVRLAEELEHPLP